MENNLPAAALAHFVMKVRDVEISYQFYAGLGLRPFSQYPGMAIIELRGGTHLLLLQNDEQSAALIPSQSGQRPDFGAEKLDLMIAGHSQDDLEQFRVGLISKGYEPSAISDQALFGHHFFSLQDPDGHGITFYTSHCGELPV